MVATVRTVDAIEALITDNVLGQDTPAMVRDLAESASSIVLSPNGVKTGNYTAVLTDRSCVVPFNVASGTGNYTIPPRSSVAIPVNGILGLLWVSGGVIQPAFVAGAGVTTVGSLTPRAAGSLVWAWQYTQDVWYTLGDLT